MKAIVEGKEVSIGKCKIIFASDNLIYFVEGGKKTFLSNFMIYPNANVHGFEIVNERGNSANVIIGNNQWHNAKEFSWLVEIEGCFFFDGNNKRLRYFRKALRAIMTNQNKRILHLNSIQNDTPRNN